MKDRIISISENVAAAHECTAVVEIEDQYPAIINHKIETGHVIRLAK
jgi:metal-dependent amidase/aminoacylase/carboxypeptidase family protein